jgi:hypothetical protein
MDKFKTMCETHQHKLTVTSFINKIVSKLMSRALSHDNSKLEEYEVDIFTEFTPKLANCTYGSDEYKELLKEMKPALDHHYSVNRHHPEYFKKYICNGCFKEFKIMPDKCDCGYSQFQEESDISQMDLVDLIEMICDWKAASMRHNDGNVLRSIEINQSRFGYGDELKSILINTVNNYFGEENKTK